MYKTLEDINRVIENNKSNEVINKFIESYLTSVAVAPYLAIEEEYLDLRNRLDVPDTEEVLDEEGNIIIEAYSANDNRDARIIELETQYPYLIESDEISIENRRPELELDLDLAKDLKLKYIKKSFEDNLINGICSLSLGWDIDCRRYETKNDLANMEALLRASEAANMTDEDIVSIRGADDITRSVTISNLRDIVIPEMCNYGLNLFTKKWTLEENINSSAVTIDELYSIDW